MKREDSSKEIVRVKLPWFRELSQEFLKLLWNVDRVFFKFFQCYLAKPQAAQSWCVTSKVYLIYKKITVKSLNSNELNSGGNIDILAK